MNYNELMAKARIVNAKRDKSDRKFGFAAPIDMSPEVLLVTAMMAIETGIKLEQWAFVAEGQAMLEDLQKILQMILASKKGS